jgi:hypothetical protein
MKTETINKYVILGTTIRFLQDTTEQFDVFGEFGLLSNIDGFFEHLAELDMNVTLRFSTELQEFKDKIELKREEGEKLTTEECRELSRIMTEVRKVFIAEGKGIYAFITTEKRFDINKLLNEIHKVFSPDTFENLPDIAQYDYKEAGKCIAFERSTAGAFHLLRGTEDVLRIYYKKFLRANAGNKTWGRMINDLRAKNRGKLPNPVTLNHLDNIRDSFRNPTQHPEKRYDIQEVQDLLGVCIDVINRMTKEIK